MTIEPKFSVLRVTRFYIPLLLQGFSQSLSYPLVAGIVTHGKFGVNALTAFSQGQMIMFMIGSLGAGLITTGLVFAKTWYGYISFRRLNAIMMSVLLALQCLVVLPPLSTWIFEGFFNLPKELADISRWTLLYGSIMNLGFFLRNIPMVVLFNNLESGKSNNATLLRIAVTLVFSIVFPRYGLVGPWWGLFALTFGVWVETIVTWLYARPYVHSLEKTFIVSHHANLTSKEILSLTLEQFRFTLPLALGGFLLACSPLVIAAFVARTQHPADMLAIHYVTMGVANPVAFAALKLQTVSVKFQPEYPNDRRLLIYAIIAGIILGIIPLIFSTAVVGKWYFEGFQNLPNRLLSTAEMVIGFYSFIAIIQAVRARIEGIAAARKHPKALMAGQIAYTVSLFIVCLIMLPLGYQGWTIAVTAIFVAPICVTITVYAMLNLNKGGTIWRK